MEKLKLKVFSVLPNGLVTLTGEAPKPLTESQQKKKTAEVKKMLPKERIKLREAEQLNRISGGVLTRIRFLAADGEFKVGDTVEVSFKKL